MLYNEENVLCINELRSTVGEMLNQLYEGNHVKQEELEDFKAVLNAFDKHVDRNLLLNTPGLDVAYINGLRHTFAVMLEKAFELSPRQLEEVETFLRQYDQVMQNCTHQLH
ncbi:Hypothetical protein LUCI_2011 [Lucifera butyrica]|uniref:Uncharacterized protein n=1 Tax=Lucifera butyrica TaxID=1351585 RepID=A0A498R6T0_9FIRM|nr:hypothetical protein [Lucifera butyrica]VBB06775.1 Hypothetical protein LUCI_2011 [Lucifera butyrica]